TKDLIVRVITPRFLTQGDEVGVPLIVHNYLATPKSLDLTLAATGLTVKARAASTPAATQVRLGANGEARLDWRFSADKVGTATVTGKAIADTDSDAVELSLPVLPFGLRRDASQSGSLSSGGTATASLTIPTESNPAARTIQVSVAPSLAGSLLGALDFLTGYPYGCTEQTLSAYLPTLVVA